jgi:predicted DNA-binding protein (MmcQ/YjbR family)
MSKKDSLIEFCRSLPGATKAFKVDPDALDHLVKRDGIVPAPYAARHSWVSVPDRRRVTVAEFKRFLAEAHRLIGEKLSKRKRLALGLD